MIYSKPKYSFQTPFLFYLVPSHTQTLTETDRGGRRTETSLVPARRSCRSRGPGRGRSTALLRPPGHSRAQHRGRGPAIDLGCGRPGHPFFCTSTSHPFIDMHLCLLLQTVVSSSLSFLPALSMRKERTEGFRRPRRRQCRLAPTRSVRGGGSSLTIGARTLQKTCRMRLVRVPSHPIFHVPCGMCPFPNMQPMPSLLGHTTSQPQILHRPVLPQCTLASSIFPHPETAPPSQGSAHHQYCPPLRASSP